MAAHRLPHPWDSPGKNTGVGCHFLLQCMKVKSKSEVTQSCPTLSDPMGSSLPGSSTHWIFQARVLEWGAIAFVQALNRLYLNSSDVVGSSYLLCPLIQDGGQRAYFIMSVLYEVWLPSLWVGRKKKTFQKIHNHFFSFFIENHMTKSLTSEEGKDIQPENVEN